VNVGSSHTKECHAIGVQNADAALNSAVREELDFRQTSDGRSNGGYLFSTAECDFEGLTFKLPTNLTRRVLRTVDVDIRTALFNICVELGDGITTLSIHNTGSGNDSRELYRGCKKSTTHRWR